jgi:hypothetical protein
MKVKEGRTERREKGRLRKEGRHKGGQEGRTAESVR